MATELLYQKDSYLREFDAAVKRVDGEKIVLDKTAFHPRSGGLDHDTGILLKGDKEYHVVKVLFDKETGEVVHYLDTSEHDIKVGDRVRGIIDWDRRYRIMRMHTAAHILIKAVRIFFNMPVKCVSASKDLDKSRLDFQAPIRREMLPQIEGIANKIVDENRRIIVKYLEPNEAEIYLKKYDESLNLYMRKHELTGKVRIVEIENLYGVPCGGTHVKSTGEVGSIKLLKRMSKGKGIVRVEYTVEP